MFNGNIWNWMSFIPIPSMPQPQISNIPPQERQNHSLNQINVENREEGDRDGFQNDGNHQRRNKKDRRAESKNRV
jgi:hypothetical protein